MFSKMLEWIRKLFSKLTGDDKAAVTDVCLSGEMETALAIWTDMYSGVNKSQLAASIAAEFARLVTAEMKAEVSGSPRADYINSVFLEVVNCLRRQTEFACAKGGMVFKPYVSGDELRVEFVQADSFFPSEFDSSHRLTGAVFVEQINRKGTIYTRLEGHTMDGDTAVIRNKAYASRTSSMLGHDIALSDVPEWATLEEEIRIENAKRPLFAYFRMPFANNVDTSSPLGASVYSRTVDDIRDADEQYERMIWEFRGGELAVHSAEGFLRPDPNGGASLPKNQQRLFQSFGTADPDFYKVFSPMLRDQSLINGLNAILRRVEFKCSLAYGTLSDVQATDKTAEEIKASKQRSYSAVSDIQKSLEAALRELVEILDILCTLYHLAPPGKIQQAYEWDDSIVADRKTEFAERMQLQTSSKLRPELNIAWYFGVDEDKALEMMSSGEEADVWGGI